MTRRRVVAVAAVLLLAAVVTGIVLLRSDDPVAPPLTVDWAGCDYDASGSSVTATLTLAGAAPPSGQVTLTVTAYADENTSKPVGSGARTVPVDGTVHESVVVTFPVDRPPHFDDDGIAACARDVEY
jgi:hypothetical protein